MKKSLLSIVLLAALPLGACVREVVVERPRRPMPPLIVEERGYPPYPGAIWVRGHWVWRGGDWFWVRGHWRPAY